MENPESLTATRLAVAIGTPGSRVGRIMGSPSSKPFQLQKPDMLSPEVADFDLALGGA
jgi:hypothetical protein